jgi:uncharacterized membrane protein YeaQ/YmgE (transglycosylase-associated protein family)
MTVSKRALIAFTVIFGTVVGFASRVANWSESTTQTAIIIGAGIGAAIVVTIDHRLERR